MNYLEVIMELAKQGMTYEQIKDLMSQQSQDEPKNEPKPEPKEPEPEDPVAGPEPENKDPEPDYKSLYEQSQKDLRAAQDLNKKQNQETQVKTEEDQLVDLFCDMFF